MPVAGQVRLRKHLFGRQSTFGTRVAAKRAYPFKGVPDNDLAWTDPDIDAGSVVVVAAPHREAPNLTAPLTDPSLRYNNLPLYLSGFFGGNVTPSGAGTAKTWAYSPTGTAPLDDFDKFTYEFGDDVVTDWFQYGDGIIESWEITGPEGKGALTASNTWRFGSISSTGSTDSPVTGTVPTPSLEVATDDAIVYLKDIGIYLADSPYDLDAGLIEQALHTFTLRASQEVDIKRWADGDQNFDVDEYGRGPVRIELECSWAKTADIVGTGSESDHWMSDSAVNRYARISAVSTVEAQSGIPYSWLSEMPMRYYTRTEGESGNNALVVLTGHAFLDPDLFDGYFTSDVVNTLATANF